MVITWTRILDATASSIVYLLKMRYIKKDVTINFIRPFENFKDGFPLTILIENGNILGK